MDQRPSRGVKGASMRIQEALAQWKDIAVGPHRYGGIEYRLYDTEIGHTHGDHQADIHFTRDHRKNLVDQGRARPHHLRSETGWVTFYIREEKDIDRAIELFGEAYRAIMIKKGRARQTSS